jgi:hypothetical protein
LGTPPEPTYTGRGLLDAGYVVAYVRSGTPVDSYVHDGLACVVVPGNPCSVLLAFTERAAVRFAAALDRQVREAQAERGSPVTGVFPFRREARGVTDAG